MKSNKPSIRKVIREILTESDNLLYMCKEHNAAYYELQGAANSLSELTRGSVLVVGTKMNEDISKMCVNVLVNGQASKFTSLGNSIFQLCELELAGTTHQLAKAINGNTSIAIVCNEYYKFKNQ